MAVDLEQQPSFHSEFGGLWIDRSDFPLEIIRRFRSCEISSEMGGQIKEFEHDGYIVLENAAAEE